MANTPGTLPAELVNLDISDDISDVLEKAQLDSNDVDDMFPVSIFGLEPSNWNRLFNYRLIIGQIQSDRSIRILTAKNKDLIYNLPIGPQNLNISMPFASQTTVLADGILVENNGIPLKQISIQGTTGVLPFRDTEQTSYDTSVLSAFAPNISRVANNVKSAVQAINPADMAAMVRRKQGIFDNSGYTQFHKLSQFLQYYAFLSKKSKNKNLRLILDMVKDNTTYIVTPKNFSLQRSASEPMEYKYSIQLEAWKRIILGNNVTTKDNAAFRKSLGERILAGIAIVRKIFRAIAAAAEMIQAIRGDIQRILDVVRTVALAMKQITGIVNSLIDLPQAIINDCKSAVAEFTSAKNAWDKAQSRLYGGKVTSNSDSSFIPKTFGNVTGVNSTSTQKDNPRLRLGGARSDANADDSDSTPSSDDQAQATSTDAPSGDLLGAAFESPTTGANLDFFDSMSPNDLNLSSNILDAINQELNRVNSLDRADFEEYRNYINEVSNDIAYSFGIGSSKLNTIKGYVVTDTTLFTGAVNRTQYELLINFREMASLLDVLARYSKDETTPIDRSFNFVGRIAQSARMPFQTSTGKFAVPVPYGASIQDIATQYLQTADRATEIIILNRLQTPYIDEDGVTQDLTNSTYKNIFNIADGNALYLNQRIIFYSTTTPPFSRNILNIQKINESIWQIEVDGDTDLDLAIADNPYIQYFAKNTVSSRDLIYIPSANIPIDLPDRLRPINILKPDSDPLIQFSKIDIALSNSNDLIFSGIGELGIAAGLSNLLQALRLKFSTPLGSLNRHPGYGFGVLPGTPISELNISDIKQSMKSAVTSDPRFKEILSTGISYDNSTLAINGVVSINSVDSGVLPFSFNIT